MPHLAPSLWFNEVNNIWGLETGTASPHKQLPLLWCNTSPLSSEVQGPWRFSYQWNMRIMELSIMQFSWACVYFLPCNSSSQYPVLRHPRVLEWCGAVLLGRGRIAVGLLVWSLMLEAGTTCSTYTVTSQQQCEDIKSCTSAVQQICEASCCSVMPLSSYAVDCYVVLMNISDVCCSLRIWRTWVKVTLLTLRHHWHLLVTRPWL